MRIAVWHNLPSGGGKRALYDHVAGLVKRGHTIEAWCPPTADGKYLPLSGLVPEHVVELAWPPVERRIGKWPIPRWRKRLLAAMDDHCRLCAAQIDAGGFDVLFANSCMFLRTTSIGRFSRTPSVLYLQEPYRWLYEALPRLPWAAPRLKPNLAGLAAVILDQRDMYYKRLQVREEVDNAAAFGKILVNSFFSRESVLRAYGQAAEVCYLGIDEGHFVPSTVPRQNYVVGFGAFTREKNVLFCIEAVSRTKEPRPKLVWIGNIANSAYYREILQLAADRSVVFEAHVNVSDQAVLDILSGALAMLYAPRLEPFGLAPLEANACGTPVIAVAEGGVRETIIHQVNGLVVDGDPAAMGAVIQKLRDDPELARRLGASGRASVEAKWGMEHAIDRLEGQLTGFVEGQNVAA